LLAMTAAMYRLGPTQSRAFRLFSPGSMFTTLGQILASFGLRFYVAHFGNYDAVYGSLGAVIVLLLWMFVSGWVFLVGAEIDEFSLHADTSSPDAGRAQRNEPGAPQDERPNAGRALQVRRARRN
jgi:membrane protein